VWVPLFEKCRFGARVILYIAPRKTVLTKLTARKIVGSMTLLIVSDCHNYRAK
jgi:hypothetical protein